MALSHVLCKMTQEKTNVLFLNVNINLMTGNSEYINTY